MAGSTPFLAQPRYEDARFHLLPPRANNNDPAMTAWQTSGAINVYANEFPDGSQVKEINGRIQLPHSYKQGSNAVIHLHWGHTNAGATANAVWQIDYWWANPNGTFTPLNATVTVSCAAADAGKHLITEIVTPTATGKVVSSLILARIFRDPGHASDAYTGSLWLLDADAHVIYDTIGSDAITSKT